MEATHALRVVIQPISNNDGTALFNSTELDLGKTFSGCKAVQI